MVLKLLEAGFVGLMMIFLLIFIFIIFNSSGTYVKLTSSRGFIRFLFQLAHIPVKIFNRMSSSALYEEWEIEKNPPEWLPPEVVLLKDSLTWKDRSYFWHLLLRSGTHAMHENIGKEFLPRLVAHSIKIIFSRIVHVLIHFPRSLREFRAHPIAGYLKLTGSFSGGAINWICHSPYKKKFVTITRKAGFPIGYYYGKRYLEDPVFKAVKNDALKAMQFIMVVYVLFGLSGWEKHIYPKNQPIVKISSADHVTINYEGRPYLCPHRGMRCPEICDAFVSWEDGLVQAVNPNLTSFVGKRLAAGDNECEVIIAPKSKKSTRTD
ncbi:MAG: hypothetical protein ACTSRW_02110 [Candidatus Helarchaeota archaeon]